MKRRNLLVSLIVVPMGVSSAFAGLSELSYSAHSAGAQLSFNPDYNWYHGCSPTAAGMMMGYYDSTYTNLIAGEAASQTFVNPYSPSAQATKNMIASAGHIADYYRSFGSSGNDTPTPGRANDSLADFMGTSQDRFGNSDGATTFFYYNNGSAFNYTDALFHGIADRSGMFGITEYIDYAGYEVTSAFNQYIDSMGLANGFTFDQYKTEIDAGRPMLVHVQGHSMYGYGYTTDVLGRNYVQVRDTWVPGGAFNAGVLEWGGSYGGMTMYGITALELTALPGGGGGG
ncbi:MAG: hypothetical protein MI922_09935, partial [Bacteroidales bacterium]|nr:hypothetical protein [Bacteroidales bacterium]